MIDREEAYTIVGRDPYKKCVARVRELLHHDVGAQRAVEPVGRGGLHVRPSVEGHRRRVVGVLGEGPVVRAEGQAGLHEVGHRALHRQVQAQQTVARGRVEGPHPVPSGSCEASSAHDGVLGSHD